MLRAGRVVRWGAAPAALSALFILAPACEPAAEAPPPATPPPAAPPVVAPPPGPRVVDASMESVGLDETALDRSVDPCQDFYQFACGKWMERTEIPADRPLWTRSFSVIADRNEAALHKILEDAAHDGGDPHTPGAAAAAKTDDPVLRKIGAYYGACMDEAAIEAEKTKPLAPLLALIKKVKDEKSLVSTLSELHKHQIWAIFDLTETQDAKDATQVIAEVDQNGLGLPDRDYYFKEDDKSKELRQKYLEYVHGALKLAGFSETAAKQATVDVMRIETELARASKTRVERREPVTMYNRLDRAGLAKAAPRFLWDDYFTSVGYPGLQAITVTAPKFVEEMNVLLEKEKPAAWKNYLSWVVVRTLTPTLPKAFVDESFRFETALTGQKEQRVRWKRCVAATDAAVGELLAQPYLKDHSTPDSTAATERDVHEISTAFGEGLEKLDWMDAATKARAHEKLKSLAYLIGYPKTWKTYDFDIKPRSYLENALAARGWNQRYRLDKVGKPVDREEWGMTPPTVNAYYRAQVNHMVFPAGILQPPFFSPAANIPVNLGGMGMVVGPLRAHSTVLRRQGLQVRRPGQPRQLVDRRRQGALQGQDRLHLRPVRQLRDAARRQAQRPAHAGREHRRQRRHQAGFPRLPRHAQGSRRRSPRPGASPRTSSSSSASARPGARSRATRSPASAPRPTPTRRRASASTAPSPTCPSSPPPSPAARAPPCAAPTPARCGSGCLDGAEIGVTLTAHVANRSLASGSRSKRGPWLARRLRSSWRPPLPPRATVLGRQAHGTPLPPGAPR